MRPLSTKVPRATTYKVVPRYWRRKPLIFPGRLKRARRWYQRRSSLARRTPKDSDEPFNVIVALSDQLAFETLRFGGLCAINRRISYVKKNTYIHVCIVRLVLKADA